MFHQVWMKYTVRLDVTFKFLSSYPTISMLQRENWNIITKEPQQKLIWFSV